MTVEDEGQYKCFVPKLRGGVKEAFVRLFVGGYKDVHYVEFRQWQISNTIKNAIHILVYLNIWDVYLCFGSEPAAVKTTVAWIYPTEFATTGLVEKEVKGEKKQWKVIIFAKYRILYY